MTVTVVVTVQVNEQELEKHNAKAARVGRAPTTGYDVVEETVSDALKHNWITAEHTVTRGEQKESHVLVGQ